MELIRKTQIKKIYGARRWFGIFKCNVCKKEFEKEIYYAKRAKNCSIKCSKLRHGESGRRSGKGSTRLYNVWLGMKGRCSNKNSPSYVYYGGKGIFVCDGWALFINFKKWASENGYADNLEIDRINSSKSYTPENCQFITKIENIVKRDYVSLTFEKAQEIRLMYENRNITMQELAYKFNTSKSNIYRIIRFKMWTSDYLEALTDEGMIKNRFLSINNKGE